jgi:phosphatidylglycerophosphatase A
MRTLAVAGDRAAALAASALGIGYLPWGPGTLASAATLAAWWLWRPGARVEWIVAAALSVIGLWAAERESKQRAVHDPGWIVIDEVAGMWLALAGHPRSALVALIAFTAFRWLDIAKPPPIRQAEHAPGGLGIMLDDLLCGMLSWVAVLAVRSLIV